MDVALQTRGLGKQYANGRWGLRDVSLALPFGSLIALRGANGSGKSTLIHLLCGALQPTTGAVQISPALARNAIAWCSQHQSLDWYLTAYDNVLLGARLAGLNRAVSAHQTGQALEIAGLGQQAASFADELSGGQQQRIQIARALVANPAVLLLDEPTAGLDIEASEKLLDNLKSRTANGAMVLVSSHDLGSLERRCDLILLLADGAVVAFEPLADLLRRTGDAEILELSFDGEVTPGLLRVLEAEPRIMRIIATNPLRLMVNREIAIPDVLALLQAGPRLREVRREAIGLREAYLALTGNDRYRDGAPEQGGEA